MAVKPIPDGHHTVTPFLLISGVADLIEFLKKAFHAEVVFRMDGPGGSVGHAEVRIGDSMIMMGDAQPEWPAMPAMIHLYVPNADEVYQRAIDAGATVVMPLTDQFYGDRSGGVKDAWGNQWWIATHIEDVPPDELQRRAAAMGKC